MEKVKQSNMLQPEGFPPMDGFPLGDLANIAALSDPPYYTACPNGATRDFIARYGKEYNAALDSYSCCPFASDISEARSGPIYNAHSYHTKIPHTAIMKYIKHYTKPGDIVYDGFCGSGMTGVAAGLLGRHAMLSDISPVASFIAYNYNVPVDSEAFKREAIRVIAEVEEECGWLYRTLAEDGCTYGIINYVIWSDVFLCPQCRAEVVFGEEAVDLSGGKLKGHFYCPSCSIEMNKRNSARVWEQVYDKAIGQTIAQAKQVPVLINYSIDGCRKEKRPDSADIKLLEQITVKDIPYWHPTDRVPAGTSTKQPYISHGVTHIHHFYTKRNLWMLSALWHRAAQVTDRRIRAALKLLISSYNLTHSTKLSRLIFKGGGQKPILTGYQSGTLYISSLPVEKNICAALRRRKINTMAKALGVCRRPQCIETKSCSAGGFIPANSIDYIFTDPPFGDNIMYSELNFLWEAWLKVFTDNRREAVINAKQNKSLADYSQLMLSCFQELYHVLKPNRWLTVVFHNSKAEVWNSLQQAISDAGFVIAEAAVLAKQQGSFKQVTAAGAVKNDLVINAYKPLVSAGGCPLRNVDEGFALRFIADYLAGLPVEPVQERTGQMLYSKMLVHYLNNGLKVTMDATVFYHMLSQHFQQREGYWFAKPIPT